MRGHITHAYTQQRRAVRDPADLLAFLDPYLLSLGVTLRWRGRLLLWLSTVGRRKKDGLPG